MNSPLSRDVLAALCQPAAYPHDPSAAAGVAQVQTHLSHVFLSGERVYKFRKDVDLGFVSFTSRQERNADCLRELICDPITVLGGSDAGAHVRQISDAGVSTYALTHWTRDKATDDPSRLPLEFVVKKLTQDGARLFGMTDRGTLEPGAKADVNLIDYDNLRVNHPEMIYDLPAGMPRLMQTATGYEKTFVSGEVVQENGKDTGARPGRIVRSA